MGAYIYKRDGFIDTDLDARANARIGELMREGTTIYYAILQGGVRVENAKREEVFAYVAAEEYALDGIRRDGGRA